MDRLVFQSRPYGTRTGPVRDPYGRRALSPTLYPGGHGKRDNIHSNKFRFGTGSGGTSSKEPKGGIKEPKKPTPKGYGTNIIRLLDTVRICPNIIRLPDTVRRWIPLPLKNYVVL